MYCAMLWSALLLTHAHCLQVFYDKSSKQSEQTAQENQRLLAENNELKEKVQEMVQESLTLQVILIGKNLVFTLIIVLILCV